MANDPLLFVIDLQGGGRGGGSFETLAARPKQDYLQEEEEEEPHALTRGERRVRPFRSSRQEVLFLLCGARTATVGGVWTTVEKKVQIETLLRRRGGLTGVIRVRFVSDGVSRWLSVSAMRRESGCRPRL